MRIRSSKSITTLYLILTLVLAPVGAHGQWGSGGSEDDYERTLANQYWDIEDYTVGSDWTSVSYHRSYSPLKAFLLDDNEQWFADHGFAAWAEYRAPFEHYGSDSQMFRFTPSEYYTTSRETVYAMGNQPPYTVELGPVPFTFNGAQVRMTEG